MYMVKKVLITSLLALFFAVPAQAVGISPVKTVVTINIESTETVSLLINNSENSEALFKLGVLGAKQDNDGYPIFGRGLTEAETWVFPENNTVSIKAKQSQKTNFIIRVPKNTEPGSYYLGLFAEPASKAGNQSGVNPRVVSLLTVQVAGSVSEEMMVQNWNPKNVVFNNKNWSFALDLKNTGRIEVSMQGVLAVRNWRGEEIFVNEIRLGNKLIAGSLRHLLPNIVVENKILWPGPYQVQVRLNYGLANQKVSAITYVWYLPFWSIVSLGVFVLILISFLAIFLLKRKK